MPEPPPRRAAGPPPALGRSDSPHVCFLSSSAPLGPGDTYSTFILELGARIAARGYRVTLLVPHVAGSAEREVLEGVSIRRFRYLPRASWETVGWGGGVLPGLRERRTDLLKIPFLLLGQHRALSALHRENPVDLLHSHWLIPQGVIGGRFARLREVPHVATAHGSDLLGLRFPGVDRALRFAVRRSDLVTVNSGPMGDELAARIGYRGARAVPIGARRPDPGAVEGNLDLRASLPGRGAVVGYVGRLVEEKGIFDFVRAFARLRDGGRAGVVGLVVGGGAGEAEARRVAGERGVAGALQFTGPVPPERVAGFMSVMDVLVVPSRYEAQGLVAIEAMLAGVPVVGCATGGLAEVIADGESGLTVPPGDVSALADAVETLLDSPVLAGRLATGGRRRALERYTLEATARRFDRAYRRLL